MTIRKGQKLCNYILEKGYAREDVHIKLFHMDDGEFDEVVGTEVDYEIPNTPEGNKTIHEQTWNIMDLFLNDLMDVNKKHD